MGEDRSRRAARLWPVALLVAAGGCYTVPPPLMYEASPIPAGHVAYGAALVGCVTPDGPVTQVLPVPALEIGARVGIGHRASLGFRLYGGPGATVDGRLDVLRTRRLSLSLGLDLGLVPGVAPAGAYAAPGPAPSSTPPLLLLGSVPAVLGWHLDFGTMYLGLRPGIRYVDRSDLEFVGTTRSIARGGVEPLAGAVLGLAIPVAGHATVHLEVDATRSFVNPGTVATLAVGLTKH